MPEHNFTLVISGPVEEKPDEDAAGGSRLGHPQYRVC